MIRQMLTTAENVVFQVSSASSLETTLDALRRSAFDVILLDLGLPDSNGFETFARVLPAAGDIPIIILSGTDDEALAVQTVKVGAQDYLVKSHINHHWLVRSIQYAVERAKLDTELRAAQADLEKRIAQRSVALREATERAIREAQARERLEAKLAETEAKLKEALGQAAPSTDENTATPAPHFLTTGPSAPPSGPISPRSARLLVVEDEPMVREILAIYLKEDHDHLEFAADGEEGLQRFRAQEFDLILTDRAMPGLNGDQLASEAKALRPNVKVILLTGYGDMMMNADDRPEGVDVIVNKPFTMASLREAIASVLSA